MSSGVVVYTMDFCPYCSRAKALLKERGIPFTEKKLDMDDDKAWAELEKKSGMKTMPQIFVGKHLVGGYQQLSSLDSNEKLADWVAKKLKE